jgi:hypothetical protein
MEITSCHEKGFAITVSNSYNGLSGHDDGKGSCFTFIVYGLWR